MRSDAVQIINPFRYDRGKEPENAHSRDASRMTLHGHIRDSADRLPKLAREKLQRLRSAATDARALAHLPYQAMREKSEAAREIDARIHTLENGASRGHPETIKIVEAERQNLAKFRDEARAHSAEHDRRKASFDALNRILKPLEDYVSTLPLSPMVEMAPIVSPKMAKGESIGDAVSRVRLEITRLCENLQSIADAPIPSVDAKRIARRQVEALAAAGAPNVLELIEGGRRFSFATTRSPQVMVAGAAAYADDVFDSEATFAWLHRDALIARLDELIDENADDTSALSAETRAKKMAQCKAAILECERLEESLIVAASEAGLTIHRRPDADPRAVLQLSDAAPAPRNI